MTLKAMLDDAEESGLSDQTPEAIWERMEAKYS